MLAPKIITDDAARHAVAAYCLPRRMVSARGHQASEINVGGRLTTRGPTNRAAASTSRIRAAYSWSIGSRSTAPTSHTPADTTLTAVNTSACGRRWASLMSRPPGPGHRRVVLARDVDGCVDVRARCHYARRRETRHPHSGQTEDLDRHTSYPHSRQRRRRGLPAPDHPMRIRPVQKRKQPAAMAKKPPEYITSQRPESAGVNRASDATQSGGTSMLQKPPAATTSPKSRTIVARLRIGAEKGARFMPSRGRPSSFIRNPHPADTRRQPTLGPICRRTCSDSTGHTFSPEDSARRTTWRGPPHAGEARPIPA